MSAKWRLCFPKVVLRLGVVALLAVLVQLLAIRGPFGASEIPPRFLLVLSYLLLIWFVTANLRRPGIVVMGAGLLLNFAAILANGGLMPVTPDALARTGYDIPADVGPGDHLPHTKDVLKEHGDVRLWFLGDRLVLDPLPGIAVFSIGDVVILAGLALTVVDLLAPRLQRVRAPDEQPSA